MRAWLIVLLSVLQAACSTLDIDTVKAGQVLGDGSGLTGVAVAPIPSRGAIYVAPRTDGKEGSGAFNDPLNASTPDKLDAAWRSFVSQSGRKLIFAPGLYFVARTLELPAGVSNLTLSGYGATLAYSNSAAKGTFHMINSAYSPSDAWMVANDNIVVEGLELDLGTYATFTGEGKTCGIIAAGANFIIRDVVIRNLTSYGSSNQTMEAFGITLQATNGAIRNVTVDGLICPSGFGGCTALGIGGLGNVVVGCTVNLKDPDPNNGWFSFGQGCFGSRNVIANNVYAGCDMGLAMDHAGNGSLDSGRWTENVFANNSISATLICFRIHPLTQAYEHWLLANNVFHAEQAPGRDGAMWVDLAQHNLNLIAETNQSSGITLIGNLFTGKPRQGPNLQFTNFKWHSLIDNVFTAPANLNVWTNQGFGIWKQGNTLNGKPYDLR